MKTPGYEKLALPWVIVAIAAGHNSQATIPMGDRRRAKARADIE
jgi:hypothetical protein